MLHGSLPSLKVPQVIQKPPTGRNGPRTPRDTYLGHTWYHICLTSVCTSQRASLPYKGVGMVLFTEWPTVGNSYTSAQ